MQENRYTPGAVYRRLLGYSKQYWWVFAIASIGMIAAATANGLFVRQVEPLVEEVFTQRNPEAMVWVPLMILGLVALRGIGSFIGDYGVAYVAQSVIRDLRRDLFAQYLRIPISEHEKTTSGESLSKATYNVGQVSKAASKAIAIIIQEGLTAIALLVVMVSYSWKLTMFFFVIVPVLFLLIGIANKYIRRYSRRIQSSVGGVAHIVGEVIEAGRVVKVFGGETVESRRFDQVNRYNRRQKLKLALVKNLLSPIVQMLVGITLALVVYIAASGILGEPMTGGEFMAFFVATGGLFAPLKALTKVNAEIQTGVAASQSIFEVLDSSPEIDEGSRLLERAEGEIDFKSVRFCYQPDAESVLRGVSFNVPAGKTIALVGASGSGKTTLVSLLPRFYDVTEGGICLDGVPIQEYRLNDLRRQISYVGQDVRLFEDTVRNNIAYGELADASDEAVLEAARKAYADEFIQQLPDGYNTKLGAGGVQLSGGQRQRISIARALLKDSPVLILDEATSALDTESERHIQDALDQLIRNRTTLVIAHRLSTVENADRIVVMDQGNVIEQGTHSELIAKGGAYANLHAMQFRQVESD